jgi:hypothetical protein
MSEKPPQPAPEPAFFDDPTIDNLLAVVLALGAELWVQRERLRVIEQLLAEKGSISSEMIEQHRPSDEERERTRIDRDAFVERIFGVLGRPTVKATPDD